MSEITIRQQSGHTSGPANEARSANGPQTALPSFRLRVALSLITLVLCGLLLGAIPFFAGRSPLLWAALLPAGWGLVRAALTLRLLRGVRSRAERVRGVLLRGIPVTGYVIPTEPASNAASSCLVLISFQPEVNRDDAYMRWLAQRIFEMRNTRQHTVDGRYLVSLTDPEDRSVLYRRRKLPISFTDGSAIFCADLFGPVPSNLIIPCIAEPGDMGGIEPASSPLGTAPSRLSLLTDKQQA